MADNGKAVINLTTGHEDADKVTVAFLVATAALAKGKATAMFLTKEAVRLGLPGDADAIQSAGAPPVQRLFEQYRDGGGELFRLPDLLPGARARRLGTGLQRPLGRSDPAVGLDWRRRDGLQLLTRPCNLTMRVR